MDKPTESTKLSLRVKMGFGVGDLGGNLFFTAMGFWALNYLTDTVAPRRGSWRGSRTRRTSRPPRSN